MEYCMFIFYYSAQLIEQGNESKFEGSIKYNANRQTKDNLISMHFACTCKFFKYCSPPRC